jgi:ACS family tartrate transporter-like MFS transporter
MEARVPEAAVSATDLAAGEVARATMRKVTLRLVPFAFLLYIVCFIDRVNVSFAALQMNRDLHFSATVYGFGAGLFFVGYVLFQVPANLILARVGARRWIATIMVVWGFLAAAMTLVTGPVMFYALRVLLGVAEAGFFPGMLLYFTAWFPSRERARAVSRFMTAVPAASIVGGPVSGLLLGMSGVFGLAGWRWLFLLEALPAIALGLVTLAYLDDRPADARWLSAAERNEISRALASDAAGVEHSASLSHALKQKQIWTLACLWFLVLIPAYGVSLWLPQIVRDLFRQSDLVVGFLVTVPQIAGIIATIAVGASSDRTGERYLHIAVPVLGGSVALLAAVWLDSPILVLGALALFTAAPMAMYGPFWALPPRFLQGTGAAAGIAFINSVGNIGGFAGPFVLGAVKDRTGSFSGALVGGSLLMLLAGAIALALGASTRSRPPRSPHSPLPPC